MINRRTCLVASATTVATHLLPCPSAFAQRPAGDQVQVTLRERATMKVLAEDFLQRHRAPGLAVAIARHGQVVYDEAFGLVDMGRSERLSTSNRFRIASASKPITAVAVFTLVQDNRIRLSDTIFGSRGVFGDRYALPPDQPWLTEITVKHLLTHTAGGWTNDGNDPMFKETSAAHDALISWTLKNQRLKTRPGSTYAYSNFGYCLLGRIIEKVTGQSYEAYVKRAVLQRAGVSDMSIALQGTQALPGEVRYRATGNGNPYGMNVPRMDSHGGWVATAGQLAKFLIHVDGFSPFPILKSELTGIMSTATTANSGYAHGWQVNKVGNWWHTGSLPGTTSIVVRTHARFCWAALVNAGGGLDGALDDLIWAMVRKVPHWDA